MNQADRAVKVLHTEWKAFVARRLGALKIVAEGEVYIKVDNLAARSHDLAHEAPAYLEGVGGNLPADRRDPRGFGTLIENQPQFFLAVGQLAFGDRIEVENAFEQTISEPIELPNCRLESEIKNRSGVLTHRVVGRALRIAIDFGASSPRTI